MGKEYFLFPAKDHLDVYNIIHGMHESLNLQLNQLQMEF